MCKCICLCEYAFIYVLDFCMFVNVCPNVFLWISDHTYVNFHSLVFVSSGYSPYKKFQFFFISVIGLEIPPKAKEEPLNEEAPKEVGKDEKGDLEDGAALPVEHETGEVSPCER